MPRYFSLFLLSISALAQSLALKEAPLLTADQNGNASATLTLVNDGQAPVEQLRLNLSGS